MEMVLRKKYFHPLNYTTVVPYLFWVNECLGISHHLLTWGMGTGEDFFWGVLHGFQGERVGDRSLPKEHKGGDFLELTDH